MVKELGEGGVVRRGEWSRSPKGAGKVERLGRLGGWGGQGVRRYEKVERREKTEMRGRDICILGVDTLSA